MRKLLLAIICLLMFFSCLKREINIIDTFFNCEIISRVEYERFNHQNISMRGKETNNLRFEGDSVLMEVYFKKDTLNFSFLRILKSSCFIEDSTLNFSGKKIPHKNKFSNIEKPLGIIFWYRIEKKYIYIEKINTEYLMW